MSTAECVLTLSTERNEQVQLWERFCKRATANDQGHLIDPYFDPDYLHLNQWIETGKPVVIYAEQNNAAYWYSFMLRPLPEQLNVSGNDITSPYGFGGELFTSDSEKNHGLLQHAQQHLETWCKNNEVVAEFIRFHSLIKNKSWASNSVDIHHVKTVCWFDLQQSEDQLWQNLHSHKRRYLKKVAGNAIQISDDWQHLPAFESLYRNSMQQKQASHFYHFSPLFFESLKNIPEQKRWLRTVFYEGEPVGSALFLKEGNHVQYFLGANNQTAKQHHLSAWLLFQTALQSKHDGHKTFTLGGGLSDNDSLFQFKKQLTSTTAPFHIGTRIHHGEKYKALKQSVENRENAARQTNSESGHPDVKDSDRPLFFYREHLELKR